MVVEVDQNAFLLDHFRFSIKRINKDEFIVLDMEPGKVLDGFLTILAIRQHVNLTGPAVRQDFEKQRAFINTAIKVNAE